MMPSKTSPSKPLGEVYAKLRGKKLSRPLKSKKGNSSSVYILSPGGGEIFEVESNVVAVWRGGAANCTKAKLQLVQYFAAGGAQVVYGIDIVDYVSEDRQGVFNWSIPPELPIIHTDRYALYVETNGNPAEWRYSEPFRIT